MAEEMRKVIEKLRFDLSSYRREYVVTSYQFAADVLKLEGYRVVDKHSYYEIHRV